MRLKLHSRTIPAYLLLGALALSACDSGNPTVTPVSVVPTATVIVPTPNPTVIPEAVPSGDVPNPVITTGPAEGTTPTATTDSDNGGGDTGGGTTEDDAALVLNPTSVETTDNTRKGVFEGERSLNLPQGFHVE